MSNICIDPQDSVQPESKLQNGSKCIDRSQCASNICERNTCLAKAEDTALPNGSACTDNKDCASNTCSGKLCAPSTDSNWCANECSAPNICDNGRCIDFTVEICTRAARCSLPNTNYYAECSSEFPIYDHANGNRCYKKDHESMSNYDKSHDYEYQSPIAKYYPTRVVADFYYTIGRYGYKDGICSDGDPSRGRSVNCGSASTCTNYLYALASDGTKCGASVIEYAKCMRDVTCEEVHQLGVGSGAKCALERAVAAKACVDRNHLIAY